MPVVFITFGGGRRHPACQGGAVILKQALSCRGRREVGGIVTLKFPVCLFVAGACLWGQEARLTPGWDIFNAPLRSGSVSWKAVEAGAGQYSFNASFQLQGAEPNHRYTVGVHIFEPAGTSRANVALFGGYTLGVGRGTISRDGVSAMCVGVYEFGTLATDASGNGSASLSYKVPARAYEMQFTVRTGVCSSSNQSGCAVV